MPFQQWLTGQEVLADEFMDYLQSQVVAVFANSAARAASWTAPPTGAISYLTDHPGILYYFDGAAWQRQGPGVVAHQRMSADVPMSSAGDLPLACSWTAQSTHTYLTQCQIIVANGAAAANTAIFSIHNGTTTVRSGAADMNPSSLANMFIMLYETGLSGAQVRQAQLTNATILSLTIGGTLGGYSEMTVIDIGGT